jgi:hypothetical protein
MQPLNAIANPQRSATAGVIRCFVVLLFAFGANEKTKCRKGRRVLKVSLNVFAFLDLEQSRSK